MKRVEGWVEMERKLPNADWKTLHQYASDISIEQARNLMNMVEPVLPDTEHRLVYVRVETTREVLD